MIFFYKQNEKATAIDGMRVLNIENCYFKKLSIEHDKRQITKKTHHHTGFEMHIIVDGEQSYAFNGKEYVLKKGSFLLIYPNVPHKVLNSAPHTLKYSITFTMKNELKKDFFISEMDCRMANNISFIAKEVALKKEISSALIENSVLETIVLALRMSGYKEKAKAIHCEENAMIALAKQYIDDNIEHSPSVLEVAEHCSLCTKHFTRTWSLFEETPPGEYIKTQRIKRIEALLADTELSLKQISDKMNFSSEYYFNAFFKRYTGMPPGEYRKMVGK